MEKKYKSKQQPSMISKPRLNRRIFFVGLALLASMGYVSSQVVAIKLQKGEDFQKRVLNRMISKEGTIMPQRGAIVDRNNKTIAASVLAYNIILDPQTILGLKAEEQTAVYDTLAKKLGKTKEEIQKLTAANPNSRYKVLCKQVDDQIGEALKKEGLKGVGFEETFTRKYPKGEFAAQLLGFYNSDTAEGQYGLEQQYNDEMLGKPGRVFSQLQDEQIVTTEVKAAQNGEKVVLTIDEVIQQYVETTMKKYIKESNPLNASAIIMNPNTGEIYSLFSYPSFDPNRHGDLEEQLGKEAWGKLEDSEKTKKLYEAWKNHATQYIYEPGSTFKPLLVAAALDENVITTKDKFVCNGSKVVVPGEPAVQCWNWQKGGHGEETLEDVLANSCNVGMMDIGEKMPQEVFLKYMNRYGFGQPTHIELPGEEKGLLRSKLGIMDQATYSFGQNFTCTPLQLITAFSAVINGGYLMQPYVVSSLVDENNNTVYQNQPKVRRQVISAETSRIVTNYLQKVVDGGTGVNAAITGYNIGGKTGTAEKQPRKEGKYVLSFEGYAPVENPQVVALLVFDDVPEHSGIPSKAFKEMMMNILPYLDIELADRSKIAGEQTSKVPDFVNKDIYNASEMLDNIGLNYEIIGVGKRVVSQYPSANTNLPKGSSVKLYVKSDQLDKVMAAPNLIGLTVQEAKTLVGDGFTISGTGAGKIVKQVPKAGHKIEKNSQIIVKTSE